MSSQFNETEDDLPLHTRGSVREAYVRSEGHAAEMNDSPAPEREVTLNTGVVLGLFFALALLCAVFFGFGYSIGHKSATAAVAAAEPEVVTSDGSTAAAAKPSPVVPQAVPEYVPSAGAPRAADRPAAPKPTTSVTVPVDAPPATRHATGVTAASPVPPARAVRAPLTPAETPVAAAAATPQSTGAGSGSTYVQVAAVSHQEDADVLLSALRRRGYAVQTRSEAGDHLIHVQLGPFGSRKEADAMRLRLAGDGYNAFIK